MSNLTTLFASNQAVEEDGLWVDLTDEMAFKIRAFGAKPVVDLRDKLMKPFAALQRAGGKIPDEKQEEIGLRVLAGAVIAAWKGVKDDEGNEIPFTEENAFKLMKDLPRFANFVIGTSMDGQAFKDDELDDSSKN